MKNYIFILFFWGVFSIKSFSQDSQQFPSVIVKTLDGQNFNTTEFYNDGNPFVLSFWATWCRPCIVELTAIEEIYEDWQEEGFKLIAVSTDGARTRNNVLPMVNGRAWDFDFYLDENGDLSRAMGVSVIPHSFIIDGNGNIVKQHRGFSDGMEWEMFDTMKSLLEED